MTMKLLQVASRAVLHSTNAYSIPHLDIEGRLCRTNLPTNTAFRGFGAPQSMFVMEEIIDHVASTLNMDPLKVCAVAGVILL